MMMCWEVGHGCDGARPHRCWFAGLLAAWFSSSDAACAPSQAACSGYRRYVTVTAGERACAADRGGNGVAARPGAATAVPDVPGDAGPVVCDVHESPDAWFAPHPASGSPRATLLTPIVGRYPRVSAPDNPVLSVPGCTGSPLTLEDPMPIPDITASHREAREFRVTASLVGRLANAYHWGSEAAEAAALDEIRAHLATPDRRVDRTQALFATATAHTAAIVRDRIGRVTLEAQVWRVADCSGMHRADSAAHYLAAQALAAVLNERDPDRPTREVLDAELTLIGTCSPAVGLAMVTEAVWLTGLAHADLTPRW